MKAAKVLWIVPIVLSCLLQGQVQVAGESETSYVADRSARKSDVPEQLRADTASVHPVALFLGSEVNPQAATAAATDNALPLAHQAIAAARERIRSNPTCQKFFHGEGEQVLEQTRFTMQYLKIPNIAAQVEGNVVLLNRNPNGAFMKPGHHVMGLTDPAEIRGFYVLHELAHELCQYTRYISDHQASAHENEFRTRMNNELLFLNCYNAKRSVTGGR
jgi:hypothetical protein